MYKEKYVLRKLKKSLKIYVEHLLVLNNFYKDPSLLLQFG